MRHDQLIQRLRDLNRNSGSWDDPFSSGDAGGGGALPPLPPIAAGETSKPGTVDDTDTVQAGASIKIAGWQPAAPYLKGLAALGTAAELEQAYEALRAGRGADPFFFVDVGDLLLEKGQTRLGLRALSNISELGIDDVQLLRMLGYRLRVHGHHVLARDVFEHILRLARKDPHSYRDLALACIDLGEYQRAANLLWEVVNRGWDRYYGSIADVALNELNDLVANHADVLDLKKFDRKLLLPTPVDLRIVLSWDSDKADIDLIVTDPANSVASYDKMETATGGRLTGDVAGGYGPEEFMVRHALPGEYTIFVRHRKAAWERPPAPTTVYVAITANFGRPGAVTKRYHRRLTVADGRVEIGKFAKPADGG